MEILTIDRSKWRTGQSSNFATGKGATYLQNKEGFRCCLGFDCIRIGIPEAEIIGNGTPWGIREKPFDFKHLKPLDADTEFNNPFVTRAIEINDDRFLNSEQREEKLKEHYKVIDVEVEFVGEYTNYY